MIPDAQKLMVDTIGLFKFQTAEVVLIFNLEFFDREPDCFPDPLLEA